MNVLHLNSLDEDILDKTAVPPHRLEPDTHIGPDEDTIAHRNIINAAEAFTPDHETAMGMVDDTINDDDILTGGAWLLAFGNGSRLETESIVTHIDGRVVDDEVPAGCGSQRAAL